MLLRRLYSSLPVGQTRPAASLSSGPSTPRPATRGRSKPARLSIASRPASASSSSDGAETVRGGSRRRRSSSSSSASALAAQAASGATSGPKASSISTATHSHPTALDSSFRPAQIYPQQMWLHQSFVPRHMPIPVHLGSRMYTAASSDDAPITQSELGPFARPAAPSALDMLRLSSATASSSSHKRSTALREHLRVTAALSRPDLVKHLGEPAKRMTPAYGSYDSSEGIMAETDLVRSLAEAGVRNRLSGEWQWEQTLARLGSHGVASAGVAQPSAAASSSSSVSASMLKQASQSQAADVDSAVDDLSALLNKLAAPARGRRKPRSIMHASTPPSSSPSMSVAPIDAAWAQQGRELRAALLGEEAEDVEDLVVRMDSVKRKRRKKISKHKYKKRRKATRAQRRKMGK